MAQTIVYIDGFNLYYGALKGTKHKWLNLDRFFNLLRPDDDILQVKYFTAVVDGQSKVKQREYLRALATTERVCVIEGKFKNTRKRCRNTSCTFTGNRHFAMPEEKQTDVNIAVQMVQDAFLNKCQHMVLVSGDSDLVPPIACIRSNFPDTKITVYVPASNLIRGQATQLRAIATKDRTLPLNLLKHCQFPPTLTDAAGNTITKPAEW